MKTYYSTFLLLLGLFTSVSAQPVNEQDSLMLVELYNTTNGASWTTSDNWLAGPVSTWNGIEVTNGRVTRIVLNDNLLAGTLPAGLDTLDALERFSVERNQLTGTIPPAFGNIASLTFLSLYANQLEGGIPDTISNLPALTFLRLGNNRLSGPIPRSLGQIQTLDFLDFGNNQLTGGIPEELAELTELRTLYLFNNPLGGEIPAVLGTMTNLVNLELIRNELTGEIPAELGNLTNLRSFSLYQNQLTGGFPDSFSNLVNLQRFYFFDNQLSGEIPEWIGNIPGLTAIWLQQNQFTGAVPASITNLQNLTQIRLDDNQLEDLPDLSGLPLLATLNVQNNGFTFEDLEPNSSIPTFEYAPQDSLTENQTINAAIGDSLTWTVDVGGANNLYQWTRDGQPLSGATDATLTLDNLMEADTGEYVLEVRSSMLDNLVLYSGTIALNVGGASVANEHEEVPDRILDLSNAPNPFHHRTTIRFSLSTPQHVIMRVFDVMGREVQRLTEGWHEAGEHQIHFDARHLPGGVYLYRLDVGNITQTRKMTHTF